MGGRVQVGFSSLETIMKPVELKIRKVKGMKQDEGKREEREVGGGAVLEAVIEGAINNSQLPAPLGSTLRSQY